MYPLLHSNEEKISLKCVRRGLIEFSTMSNGSTGSTRGWRGDIVAILLMGVLSLVPVLLPGPHPFTPGNATLAALDRLFANPASTVENLFYFGFLTERLLYKTKWLTPLLIAAMYTIHEMSNPEYWYGHLSFVFVFVVIAVAAAVYLWRRSLVVTWLGDIISRCVTQLF